MSTQEVQVKTISSRPKGQLILPSANRQTAALSGMIDSVLHKLSSFQSDRHLGCLNIAVVSNQRRVGVSTVAHRLAMQAALNGEGNILIVDANSAHAAQHKLCGVAASPGLAEFLSGDNVLEKCIQESVVPHLDVLVWGEKTPANFAVTPAAIKELFADLRSRYQYVFIDLPWMDEQSGTASLAYAMMSDAAVIVLEGTSSRETPTRELVEMLDEHGVKILGAVMNRFAPSLPRWLRRWF